MPDQFAVKISGVEFKYPTAKEPILRLENFSLKSGEKVFLRGDSGSGKSTLLGLITGILTANKGSAFVLGKDFTKTSNAERDQVRGEQMGYIFQQFNLIPYLSTEKN